MKRQPNNNGGFSLLEVILAMAILAIISIPLLSYFTQSMKYNAMMADKQHATNLAQEVLEDLKNQKELAQIKDVGTGFRVPYLEGKGYTLLLETPAAAPAPAFQAKNVYYASAGISGRAYDVEVSVSTAEPLARVLLSCEYAVKDFKVLGIEASPMSNSLSFSTEELYALDELSPDRPLLLNMTFYGLLPYYGVSYVDDSGETISYSINMSGEDGSVILTEFLPYTQ